jgi:hypothetical protein
MFAFGMALTRTLACQGPRRDAAISFRGLKQTKLWFDVTLAVRDIRSRVLLDIFVASLRPAVTTKSRKQFQIES